MSWLSPVCYWTQIVSFFLTKVILISNRDRKILSLWTLVGFKIWLGSLEYIRTLHLHAHSFLMFRFTVVNCNKNDTHLQCTATNSYKKISFAHLYGIVAVQWKNRSHPSTYQRKMIIIFIVDVIFFVLKWLLCSYSFIFVVIVSIFLFFCLLMCVYQHNRIHFDSV